MRNGVELARSDDGTLTPPLRIVVTGDTHLGRTRRPLPEQLLEAINETEYVIHTGDFTSLDTLDEFHRLSTLIAVSGNNDDLEIEKRVPDRAVLRAGSLRILVTHGHRERGSSARDGVRRAYSGMYDIVIYGHSHMPEWELAKGTWFLNPGSPTNRRRAPQYSFALLEIGRDETFDVAFCCFDMPGRSSSR